MAREKNFDKFIESKQAPAAYTKAKAEYERLAKIVATTPDADPKYGELRKQKLAAAVAMSNARQAAEAEFFADEVKEVADAVAQFKEEQAKKAGTAAA